LTVKIYPDPGFKNAAQRDFRLKPNSPALKKTGFKPFDYSQAGVYGDAAWKAKAANVSFPPLQIAPESPPIPIRETFEHDTVGKPPRLGNKHVENKGDQIK
jgi:hypothetical protein